MREWMKLFEDQDDDAAEREQGEIDARMSAVYDRERAVETALVEICDDEASLDIEGPRAVTYSEENNRLATIRVAGPVTMAQLMILSRVGDDITISHNDSAYGVVIEMIVKPDFG